MDKNEIIYLLRLLSDRRNWKFEKDWGPYGEYWNTYWLGDEEIWEMASELLEKLEGESDGY